MNPPGLDLLLRLIKLQLEARPCERCGEPLNGTRIKLRESKAEQVVVEAVCPACDQALLLQVRPEADGVARVN